MIRLELTKSGRRREVPLGSNADAVLAKRWTPAAKGYVFGSRNWHSFRSAWEAALDGILPALQSEPASRSAQGSAQEPVELVGVSRKSL